ncbi:hypothetical protein HZB03_03595 [Candidatus Woesearchaeota archaeon]|nr:hypothetical protein [Candidatus Woesearchaeota archaeon]
MAKKRRGLLGILFGRPAKEAGAAQANTAPAKNVVLTLDGDTLVDLIGTTVLLSIAHMRLSSPGSYNVQHFQYYVEFHNCSINQGFARYMTGDVRKRLGLHVNAQPYLKAINGLEHGELEEGITRAVVKYKAQIDDFWNYYRDQHLKSREIQQSTDTQEPAATEQKKWV